jgi:TRAP-type C4-dicarboxylate transport system substrate-binding protein
MEFLGLQQDCNNVKRREDMRQAIGLLAGVAIAATFVMPANAQHVMRIGMVTINDAQHTFTQKYAEELMKRTNNQIKVEVFTAGQLGSIPRQIEMGIHDEHG